MIITTKLAVIVRYCYYGRNSSQLFAVTQRPQSAGDRVDCAHEDHTSQPATQDDIEVRPSAGDAAAQTGAQLAPVSNGASTTTHAAPVPAATAFIAQWKPAITQAWIN